MTFQDFLANTTSTNFLDKIQELITTIFEVGKEPDPTTDEQLPDDTLTIFSDILTYLSNRYTTFDCLYQEPATMDRLLFSMLQSNALEFAKVITIWRSAKLEYEKLLIGDSANNVSSISYSGLNATGTYTTTTNDAKSVNAVDALSKMVNRAQTEVYLFLDRIIQPYLRITY